MSDFLQLLLQKLTHIAAGAFATKPLLDQVSENRHSVSVRPREHGRAIPETLTGIIGAFPTSDVENAIRIVFLRLSRIRLCMTPDHFLAPMLNSWPITEATRICLRY